MIKIFDKLRLIQRAEVAIYAVDLCTKDKGRTDLDDYIRKAKKYLKFGYIANAAVAANFIALHCTNNTSSKFHEAPNGSAGQVCAICSRKTINHVIKNIGFYDEIKAYVERLNDENEKQMFC